MIERVIYYFETDTKKKKEKRKTQVPHKNETLSWFEKKRGGRGRWGGRDRDRGGGRRKVEKKIN